MKKIVVLVMTICLCLMLPSIVEGKAADASRDFFTMFNEHGAVMLLIDPDTGDILYANQAASVFYGYPEEKLISLNISDINTLTPQETAEEMRAAANAKRNYFIFKHRLADGEIRNVEVFSYPVIYGGHDVLFSIVHDITTKTLLAVNEKRMTIGIIIAGSIVIAVLLLLLSLLVKNQGKLKNAKNEFENFYALTKTFIDADSSLIYLKDENLKYVFVNKAFEAFYQKKAEQIIGSDDLALTADAFARKRRQTDLAVLKREALVVDEEEWDGHIYKTTKFPVKMLNGEFGVGAYKTDITEERTILKKQAKVLFRQKILVDVLNRSFQNTHEQLDYVLHEALKLTDSQYGYIYLYDEGTAEFILNSWTQGVMEDCAITKKETRYLLAKTGIWGEVVRQRKPIVINDFAGPNPLKKGYPEGHMELTKFMSIPVIIDGQIVAVVGLANKQDCYDDNDVYETTLLMSGAWYAVERREAQERLILERNKYLQTLISIGDGVMVVDHHRKVEMLNKAAERMTGWRLEEALNRDYKDIFVLAEDQEDAWTNDPIELVFETNKMQEVGSHAVLISRNGRQIDLEDSAAPIKDETDSTMGVVLVFRDVTDKNEQRKEIEYLSFHDALTGLYNRGYFNAELNRLNTERNLPISVVMGDVNGLKLTNDIFGHIFGDMLLVKAAENLKKACRRDDIVARWGGDEFVMLLPKTGTAETEKIVERIEAEFAKEQIKAINGSISMGFAVKLDMSESIEQVLNAAEEKMYAMKTLKRHVVNRNAMNAIISTLHENSREKTHSDHVSELSQEIGRSLGLSEVDIRKLKEAGCLHDIGKIVLDPMLLTKNGTFSDQENNEIMKHPTVGYRILNAFDNTLEVAEFILTHHEHWNGHGYPQNLSGEGIPLLSRIIAIADCYDRMLFDSSNNQVMSENEASQIIRGKGGRQFDPVLAERFSQMIEAKMLISSADQGGSYQNMNSRADALEQ